MAIFRITYHVQATLPYYINMYLDFPIFFQVIFFCYIGIYIYSKYTYTNEICVENLNKNHPHYTIYNTFSFFVSLYIFYVIFLCVKHVRTYSFTFCQYNIPGSIGTRFIVAWFVIIFLYIYTYVCIYESIEIVFNWFPSYKVYSPNEINLLSAVLSFRIEYSFKLTAPCFILLWNRDHNTEPGFRKIWIPDHLFLNR